MSKRALSALTAFSVATSRKDYRRAMRLAAGCCAVEQMAMVDTIIESWKRTR